MIRKFVPIDKINPYDEMHFNKEGEFEVDEAADGASTEEHRRGIDYIKEVLKKGQKIRPILLWEKFDGTFERLDGFKRYMAHKELGYKFIEALVCDEVEHANHKPFPYHNATLTCWKGGQPKEDYTLFEGGERPDFDYDTSVFLYDSPDPQGLKIEAAECIHVHIGKYGGFRLSMGRRDFVALATAISSIWGK